MVSRRRCDAARAHRTPWLASQADARRIVRVARSSQRELADSGFLYPPAKYDSVVRSMRATVHRAKLTYQEVQTIRGMIVALVKNKHRVKKE